MPRQIFTTEKVAELVGIEPWRVIKFTLGKEYGIEPSLSPAAGSGTRRLYDLEDICQIALAVRLLETGLRSKAIGRVIRQVRQMGKLSTKLSISQSEPEKIWLAVSRTPLPGKLLKEQRPQSVAWIRSKEEAVDILSHRSGDDLVLVPLGSMFFALSRGLRELEAREKRT